MKIDVAKYFRIHRFRITTCIELWFLVTHLKAPFLCKPALLIRYNYLTALQKRKKVLSHGTRCNGSGNCLVGFQACWIRIRSPISVKFLRYSTSIFQKITKFPTFWLLMILIILESSILCFLHWFFATTTTTTNTQKNFFLQFLELHHSATWKKEMGDTYLWAFLRWMSQHPHLYNSRVSASFEDWTAWGYIGKIWKFILLFFAKIKMMLVNNFNRY